MTDIINHKAQELYPDFIPGIEKSAAEPFRKGVEWATSDPLILQGLLQPFGEFLRKSYEPWYTQWKEYKSGKTYTTEELIQKYFADNKQKEDARP